MIRVQFLPQNCHPTEFPPPPPMFNASSYGVQSFLMPTISHNSHFISNLTKIPAPQEFPPQVPTQRVPTRNSLPAPRNHPLPALFPPPSQHFTAQSFDSATLGGPSASESRIAPAQDAVCGQPSFGGVGLGPVVVPPEHCRCSLGMVGASEEPRAPGSRLGRLWPRLLLQQVGRFLGALPLEPLLGCDGHPIRAQSSCCPPTVLTQPAWPSAGVCGLGHRGSAAASSLWLGRCQCAARARCSCC